MESTKSLVSFQSHTIRRFFDEKSEKWYFSVVDIVAALVKSTNPAVYWRVLKKRLKDEGANETVTKCNALKMPSADGKMRLTDMADTETLLRLIQSIPSPKTEPIKLWLARYDKENNSKVDNETKIRKEPKNAIQYVLSYPKNRVNHRNQTVGCEDR